MYLYYFDHFSSCLIKSVITAVYFSTFSLHLSLAFKSSVVGKWLDHLQQWLQNFQYKLLHRIFPTNTFLFKIGIKDSDLCSFCKIATDFIMHYIWQCPKVQEFWQQVGRLKERCINNGGKTMDIYKCINIDTSFIQKTKGEMYK
jgi:hypothetical protein